MKCILVPTSSEALIRLDLDECIDGDLIEEIFNEDDYDALWKTGVFNHINNHLSINIDDYENEELLGANNLLQAKSIVEGELFSSGEHILIRLLSQINKGIAYNTGVFFYF